MDTRSLNSSHLYRTPPKNLVFIPDNPDNPDNPCFGDRAPLSGLRMYKSLKPQPWSRSTTAFIPILGFFFSSSSSEDRCLTVSIFPSYTVIFHLASPSPTCAIPSQLLPYSICLVHPEMNTKSFIALTFLALASFVNAVPARQFPFLGLFVREGLC
jgi:hypothetical protein